MGGRARRHEAYHDVSAGLCVGDEVDVLVGSIAHGGHCVARHDNQVIFVRHALPGEHVRVTVTEVGPSGRFVRADATVIHEPAPTRRVPPCPAAGPGGCGGCDLQHTDAATGRRLKAQVVREQLSRLGGLDVEVTVEALPGDEDGLRWRTRQRFAVDAQGRAGLRKHRSHEVIALQDCPIASRAIIGTGVLSRTWPGAEAVDAVVSGTAEVHLMAVSGSDGPRPQVHEPVAAAAWSGTVALAAGGFWQVHPGAPAAYVDAVLAAADPQPGQRCLDLYAGAGLFALPLADAVGGDGHVDAVESDRQAVADGIRNAQGRPHLRFHRGRVDAVLRTLARQPHPHVVVLDPPRAGAGRGVVRMLAGMAPRVIVYIACDPAALGRDTAYLREQGWVLRDLRAFDAFPMTHHVECIATFHRERGGRRG